MKLVQIYFKRLNKLADFTNFLAFFLFLFEKFFLLDPDTGGKMNADPCGSGSIALAHFFSQVKKTLKPYQ